MFTGTWSLFCTCEFKHIFELFHAQYDWTTGVPDNGNEWRKFRAVPRLYPLSSLVFCTLFNRDGNRRAFRLPGGPGSFPLYGGTFARSYLVSKIPEISSEKNSRARTKRQNRFGTFHTCPHFSTLSHTFSEFILQDFS